MRKTSVPSFPRLNLSLVFALSALVLTPSLVQAHVPGHGLVPMGGGPMGSWVAGFGHPLGGLDHLCAMLAIGLWAAQMGGRAILAVPLTFVSVMVLGGVIGMEGFALPMVEPGIVLSVLMLGIFIAASVRLPLPASIIIAGLFALFHGHAHGAEMPADASGFFYAAGFVVATLLLHVCGAGMGIGMQKLARPQIIRCAGIAIVFAGIWLGLN